jgi:hypothetical protein
MKNEEPHQAGKQNDQGQSTQEVGLVHQCRDIREKAEGNWY